MNVGEFRKVIQERIQCHDEWTDGIDQCWQKEIALLTEDVPSTIEFLKYDCTADEYSWISEVLEDVVETVPSKELVRVYKELMDKFPEECSLYNIAFCIEQAETILKWEDSHAEEN